MSGKVKHHYVVLRANRGFAGHRFPVRPGEIRTFRYLSVTPRVVTQARKGESIDWGGASVDRAGYDVLFDGKGWDNCQMALRGNHE